MYSTVQNICLCASEKKTWIHFICGGTELKLQLQQWHALKFSSDIIVVMKCEKSILDNRCTIPRGRIFLLQCNPHNARAFTPCTSSNCTRDTTSYPNYGLDSDSISLSTGCLLLNICVCLCNQLLTVYTDLLLVLKGHNSSPYIIFLSPGKQNFQLVLISYSTFWLASNSNLKDAE